MRVTILGGGGFRVPLIHDALLAAGLPVDRIMLHDIDPGRLGVMISVLTGGPPIATTTELDTAVTGADVIFSAIRVGGLDGRVRDERDALAAGVIGQETVGAGGLSYALRAVPEADRIARRVAALAPNAWVVTMTNPAGIVTEAMADVLGARVVGVCDSPVALVRRACRAAGHDPGPSAATVDARIAVDYLGLNHLGWLRALHVAGTDVLPRLVADEPALLSTEEGRLFGADLIRALGGIPNEYLYWYYARDDALRDVLAAPRTRGEHVREQQTAFYAAAAADPSRARALWQQANDERNRSYFAELRDGARDEQDVAAGGYEAVAVALAAALTGGPQATLILNVRNGGTVAALAADAVIETVCRVDTTGAAPLPTAPPTGHQLGLMSTVKACEQAIVRAARTGSAEAALRAYALHPLVGSLDAARTLAHASLPRR